MKKWLLELIRKVLRRIILPIRKKREELLSNFRFSMAFRISVAYSKLMLVYGIFFMLGFCVIYLFSAKENYDRMAEDFLSKVSLEENMQCENCYYERGISVKIEQADNKKVLFDDIRQDIERNFHYGFSLNTNAPEDILLYKCKREFAAGDVKYRAYFQYDMTEIYYNLLSIAWKVALLYLTIVLMITRRGKRRDAKLFEPVRIMSAIANRLTVNNLHSERLNVEGTKNELKDLANVINAMLDRIETSYESQKQFVSDASHELRTPIAVIQGYINMLNRWGSTNEEVLQESIEAIQNEARSMQDLVEKLLFLSRHDKKTLKLTKKRFNMRPIVEDMVKETRLVASNRIIESPVIEDVIVYGDKQALKQAIRILIDNAVKYTKDGDTITILCQKVNGDCVITVSDTGIGMTKKDIDNIFNRFYRSDHVRNQNISGHGLGLSLAKLIILAHTGKIKVRSQFKKGSSFIITLPKRRY
jgi:two-component system sensor histidine kinase ArlS